MMSILKHLDEIFNEAIQSAFPDYVAAGNVAIVTEISNPKFGDYQCNNALAVNKFLKERNINKPPMEIANQILNCVRPSPIIAKVNIAGIGFLNIFLDKWVKIQWVVKKRALTYCITFQVLREWLNVLDLTRWTEAAEDAEEACIGGFLVAQHR